MFKLNPSRFRLILVTAAWDITNAGKATVSSGFAKPFPSQNYNTNH
ncbi:MAG: hypothetical protein HXX08_12825 [Chloroflexi bacterium]|uniref:Uncharacterized protein n=1 Tax=Candidatus Chlorohelix allophototropha TaxID=3003348 RepID=A0A8T7M3V8_9CHLR|nr:hypothetical protein [Chloroflexota bacterium]WJW69982.1 hypothetical protein OZ401_004783 [Chloroflexota bacterium L227-S17]